MSMYPVIAAVIGRLVANNGISTAVGSRVYAEARAQDGALPCIIVAISEDESRPGLVPAASTLRKAEVELMVVALTAKQANEIAELIRASLHEAVSWTATVGGASIHVLHSLHSRSLTNYQPPSAGESTGAFTHSSMYSIMYQRTT